MHTPQAFPTPPRNFEPIQSDDAPLELEDVSPLPGGILAVLTVAFGIAACLWGVLGLVLQGDVTPNSGLAMIGAGSCFIVGGLLMHTRSLVFPLIAIATGILFGIASRTMF
jgi:hypothetical protein